MYDDLESDLDAYLAEADAFPHWDQDDRDDEGWMPASEEEVDRLLRHCGRAEAEEERLRAFHRSQVARLDEWLADRTAGPQRIQNGARRALEGWCRKVWDRADGHAWKLPFGVLRLTAARESLEVTDEAVAVAWCEANDRGDLVKKALRGLEVKSMVRAVSDPEELSDGRKAWQAL